MLYFNDSDLPEQGANVRVCRRVGQRRITHAFHDIDGTHSLIRDWQPVMSALLGHVIEYGLPDNFDDETALMELVGKCPGPSSLETDRFCVESAGLSALTQMEWAIRRGIDAGSIDPAILGLNENALISNREVIDRIWQGEETFDHLDEAPSFKDFLRSQTPRLFQLYEKLLNRVSRDRNLARARSRPEDWCVPGSHEFLGMLREAGVLNFFVTGAVVMDEQRQGPAQGMAEEVDALGFEVGPGCLIEALHGSSWSVKRPKRDVMRTLCRDMRIDPRSVLVVGDGRSEIAAGVEMGAVTLSRLPENAARQRELHEALRVNVIASDYTDSSLLACFRQT